MEPTTDLSPLSSLGSIIGWLIVGLAIVFTMLAVLRLLDLGGHELPRWRARRRQTRQRSN